MTQVIEFLETYGISKPRITELLSKQIIILPVEKKEIKGSLFLETIDFQKRLREKEINVDYIYKDKQDFTFLAFHATGNEIAIFVLQNVVFPILIQVLSAWIIVKYIKENKKNANLKIKIYVKEDEKVSLKEFEGSAEHVLKALKKLE